MRDQRQLPSQRHVGPGAQPQFRILPRQGCRLQSATHNEQQTVGLERLFDEIVGAVLDRADRHFDRAVAGDHHHRHMRFLAVQRLQDADPIHTRTLQPHVQDHQ